MRSRFAAIVAALVLSVSTAAQAEIYTMYTFPTASASNTASSISINLNALGGLINVTIPSPNPAGVTGTVIADMNLDASDTGTLYLVGGQLTLANVSGSASTILGTINYSLQNVGLTISAGPISVVNGAYSITSATAGQLTLNQGTIVLTGAIPTNLDFGTSPVVLPFSSLGSITLPGNADDSASIGFDQIDSNPHTSNVPGLTGVSTIDDDGSEVRLRWAGASIVTTITSGALTIPLTITLGGAGVSVGVPEAGTFVMMGIAAAGFGLVAARRRRSA